MKIGSSDTDTGLLDDVVEEAPDTEAPETGLLDDVLNKAAEAASSSEEVIEPGFVFDNEALAFMNTYRVGKSDLGQTPMQLLQDLKHADREPDPDEEAILDALLFEGRYEREAKIGQAVIVMTTFSSRVEQHARRYMQRVHASDPDGFSAAFNAIIVARCLASVAGRATCSGEPGTEEFESEKALEERMAFCMRMPTDLLDGIGAQVNSFLKTTSGVMARSLSDF